MTIFSCTACNFLTEQKKKWDRHCATTKHQTFIFLCSQVPCDFSDVGIDNNLEELEEAEDEHRYQIDVEPQQLHTPMETDTFGYPELSEVDQEHGKL